MLNLSDYFTAGKISDFSANNGCFSPILGKSIASLRNLNYFCSALEIKQGLVW
jgi:hypothetical protein